MANQITQTTIQPVSAGIITQTSRYINSNVIYYGPENILTFTTYKRTPPSTDTSQNKYIIVDPGTQYRPDLMSYNIYGIVDYWWKIMEANGLSDVFDFKAGLNITLPSMNNIFS